jgi:D-alanyl-D-alanine carboxypeptidase
MKKILIFFLVCFLFLSNVYAAECEVVMDEDSGRVLYSKNIDKEKLIASTTKVMTALVVLNNTNINDEVTVSSDVTKAYGSSIYIKPGEKLKVKDLLYGLLLRSGNDAAIMLAIYTGGSISGFAKLMNDTAISIGMKNTKFSNPTGLDEESSNTSSVYDMALLLREANKNKIFRKITRTKVYSLKTNFNTYKWYNKNKLLNMYKYTTGGKIGYTKKARHTFVSSSKYKDKRLIVATFNDDDQFNNHKYLYEKYFSMYNRYKLIDKNNLNIDYSNEYKLFAFYDFYMLLNNDDKRKVKREVILYNSKYKCLSTCLIGKIYIKYDNKVYMEEGIYAKYLSKKYSYLYYLRKFIRSLFVI